MRWREGQVFVWRLNRAVREGFSMEEKLKLNCEKELALGKARGEYSRQIKQQYTKTKKEKKIEQTSECLEDSKNGVEGTKMRFYRCAKASSLGAGGQDKDLEFDPKGDMESLKMFK